MSTRRSSRLAIPAIILPQLLVSNTKKRKIKEEVLDDDKPILIKRSKGKVPKNESRKCISVDIFVPGGDDFEVITVKGNPLTAMLNQTNLAQNNNKFFLIQALQRKDGCGFATWFRWGRVGYSGQTNLQEFSCIDKAVEVFESKFVDKTCNDWSIGVYSKFKTHVGKYTLLPVETLTRALEDASGAGSIEITKIEVEPTKLDPCLFDLIKLISSKDMFERELKIAGIDLTKMPLGQMSKKMISDGYLVLQKLEKIILNSPSNRQGLIEFSNQFFTVIPHNFGFTKGINYVINTFGKLKEKTELLESLSQVIETGQDLKKAAAVVSTCPNPIDDHYARMGICLQRLAQGSSEFQLIETYKKNTQGETHSNRSKIRNIFKINNFSKSSKPKSLLLWHGSRLTNWHSILTHGLKIAPPEAPHTGFMFDKGVYTADCFSKSANYCFSSGGVGLLVLCEVDLGTSLELTEADHSAKARLGSIHHSTKGVGMYYPDPTGFSEIDGVTVPCGVLKKKSDLPQSRRATPLRYNEYVVYDTRRIRMRYLVEVEFGR